MKSLTILYDGRCGLCWRAVKRLSHEPAYLPLHFEPSGSSFALDKFGSVLAPVPGSEPDQVIVIADSGEIYRGVSAWIMVLYALRRYRPLAMRLSTPRWRPLAARAIDAIGRTRHFLSDFLMLSPEPHILAQVAADARLSPTAATTCASGACDPNSPRAHPPTQPDPSEVKLQRLIDARRQVRAEWRAQGIAVPSPAPSIGVLNGE